MADNITVTSGSYSATIASDDIAGVAYQRVKGSIGADGTATDPIGVSAALDSNGTGVQAVGMLAQFDDSSTATVTENNFAAPRISSRRALLVEGVTSGIALASSIADGSNVTEGAIADAAVTAGASGSISAKLRSISRDLIANIVLAAGTNIIGYFGLAPRTSGGLSTYKLISAGTTNAQSVKGSAGQLYGWYISSSAVKTRYIKFYNKASAPTVGSDTPVLTLGIPGGGAANIEYTNGIDFTTGIAIAMTVNAADADSNAITANDITINLLYK